MPLFPLPNFVQHNLSFGCLCHMTFNLIASHPQYFTMSTVSGRNDNAQKLNHYSKTGAYKQQISYLLKADNDSLISKLRGEHTHYHSLLFRSMTHKMKR